MIQLLPSMQNGPIDNIDSKYDNCVIGFVSYFRVKSSDHQTFIYFLNFLKCYSIRYYTHYIWLSINMFTTKYFLIVKEVNRQSTKPK
jgi:hypothetical protein